MHSERFSEMLQSTRRACDVLDTSGRGWISESDDRYLVYIRHRGCIRMSELNKPIAFIDLLERCRRIEIPLIQRDYAQGRDAEKDVRDDFLKAIHAALSLPSESPELPLNLDFIYGSMEGLDKKSFLPFDGQQRLTTLFLLHWYLAWRDGGLSDFK